MKKKKETYDFKMSCVGCRGVNLLESIIENSKEITYQTIKKAIGASLLNEYFSETHLKIKDDYAVSFYSSKVDNIRYYIVKHSGIEYIFAPI